MKKSKTRLPRPSLLAQVLVAALAWPALAQV